MADKYFKEQEIIAKKSEIINPIGSPGFKICNQIKGSPQIIEIWNSKEWLSSDRCIFLDGSFIDNGSLMKKIKWVN